jgi:hypothetical protein
MPGVRLRMDVHAHHEARRGREASSIVFAEHLEHPHRARSGTPRQYLTCAALLVLHTLINVLGVRGQRAASPSPSRRSSTSRCPGDGHRDRWASLRCDRFRAVVAADGGDRWRPARRRWTHFASVPAPKPLLAGDRSPVMAAIMWTYDGWSDVGAIAGEVRDPERQLPRIYFLGTVSVIVLYVLANAVYLWHIPIEAMREATTVAPLLIERLIGPAGAVAVTLMILVSTIGSSHASVMTGARVTFAQARDGLLFRFLGRIHPRYETPAVSLWTQCALSCVAVLILKDFANLAGSFVFTMWIFYGMGAIALFVLRARRHAHPRPYRVPGYPVVPAIFVLASAAMTVLSIIEDPKTTLIWIGVLLAGVPVYLLWKKSLGAARSSRA